MKNDCYFYKNYKIILMRNTQAISDGAYNIYYGNFYKYLGVQGALATLKSGKLKYSNPKMFNDPLDCNERQIYFDEIDGIDDLLIINSDDIDEIVPENSLSVEKKNLVVSISKLFGEVYTRFNPEQKESAKKFINRYLIQPEVREEIKKMKICCFSRNYMLKRSSLMWSHYADNHSGICLEFNIKHFVGRNEFTKNLFVPFVVNYHPKLEIKKIDPKNEYHNDWLLNKLNIWDYEQEVRIFRKTKQVKDYEYYNFPKSSLKKVIFGYQTKLETIKEIKDILIANFDLKKIKFEKMAFHQSTFKLLPLKYDIEQLRHDVLIDKDDKIRKRTEGLVNKLIK